MREAQMYEGTIVDVAAQPGPNYTFLPSSVANVSLMKRVKAETLQARLTDSEIKFYIVQSSWSKRTGIWAPANIVTRLQAAFAANHGQTPARPRRGVALEQRAREQIEQYYPSMPDMDIDRFLVRVSTLGKFRWIFLKQMTEYVREQYTDWFSLLADAKDNDADVQREKSELKRHLAPDVEAKLLEWKVRSVENDVEE